MQAKANSRRVIVFPPKAWTIVQRAERIGSHFGESPAEALSRRAGGTHYHRFHRNKRPVNSMGKCLTCGKAGKVRAAVDGSGEIGENDRRQGRPGGFLAWLR